MKLSKSKIKKFLTFSQKKLSALFSPSSKRPPLPHILKKQKKNPYISGNGTYFLVLILKKFRKRKPRKKFLIFQETETLKKLLIFLETKSFSLPRENFLHFRKWKPRTKKFLYFPKQNFLVFQEPELCYISKKVYLEALHIQNFGIFKTRDIFRTLSNIYDGTFCKNSYLAIKNFSEKHALKKTLKKNRILRYFLKEAFIMFPEMESLKRKL